MALNQDATAKLQAASSSQVMDETDGEPSAKRPKLTSNAKTKANNDQDNSSESAPVDTNHGGHKDMLVSEENGDIKEETEDTEKQVVTVGEEEIKEEKDETPTQEVHLECKTEEEAFTDEPIRKDARGTCVEEIECKEEEGELSIKDNTKKDAVAEMSVQDVECKEEDEQELAGCHGNEDSPNAGTSKDKTDSCAKDKDASGVDEDACIKEEDVKDEKESVGNKESAGAEKESIGDHNLEETASPEHDASRVQVSACQNEGISQTDHTCSDGVIEDNNACNEIASDGNGQVQKDVIYVDNALDQADHSPKEVECDVKEEIEEVVGVEEAQRNNTRVEKTGISVDAPLSHEDNVLNVAEGGKNGESTDIDHECAPKDNGQPPSRELNLTDSHVKQASESREIAKNVVNTCTTDIGALTNTQHMEVEDTALQGGVNSDIIEDLNKELQASQVAILAGEGYTEVLAECAVQGGDGTEATIVSVSHVKTGRELILNEAGSVEAAELDATLAVIANGCPAEGTAQDTPAIVEVSEGLEVSNAPEVSIEPEVSDQPDVSEAGLGNGECAVVQQVPEETQTECEIVFLPAESEAPPKKASSSTQTRAAEGADSSQFVCFVCFKVFPDRPLFRAHFYQAHKDIHMTPGPAARASRPRSRRKKKQPLELRFSCDQCDERFPTRIKLGAHFFRTHTSLQVMFPCELCQKKFRSKELLQSHLLTHKEGRLFECGVCKRALPSKDAHDKHVLTHIADKAKPGVST